MVAVGNRPGGYGPHELATLEALAPAMAELLACRRRTAIAGPPWDPGGAGRRAHRREPTPLGPVARDGRKPDPSEQRQRRRLAKLLHDGLQQVLVAARMKVAGLRRRVDDEALRRSLTETDEMLDECINESRLLTAELSPPVLYDAGLAAGLLWLARRMEEKYGLAVTVEVDLNFDVDDEVVKVFLFQAVRELLFNAVKHAQTTSAAVTMKQLADGQLEITVTDRGTGSSGAHMVGRNPAHGFGLFNIRERLGLLGGSLEMHRAGGRHARDDQHAAVSHPARERRGGRRGARRRRAAAHGPPVQEQPPACDYAPRRIRVLLVDDHPILRKGMADLVARACRDRTGRRGQRRAGGRGHGLAVASRRGPHGHHHAATRRRRGHAANRCGDPGHPRDWTLDARGSEVWPPQCARLARPPT